jgi:hypothetical protein
VTIDLNRYDLADKGDVERLAADVGGQFVDLLVPLMVLIDPAMRTMFMSCALAVPVGSLFAVTGPATASLVLDTLKEQGREVLVEQRARTLN